MTHPTLKAYANLFENLSPDLIERLGEWASEDIRFKDPFNDITGISALQKLLHKTLDDVANPNFTVTHIIEADGINIIRWHFKGHLDKLGLWEVTGLSEVVLNEEGRISSHIDYWDASEYFYMKIPIIGWLLRKIRQRLQV